LPYKDKEKRLAHSKSYGKAWYAENGEERRAQIYAQRRALRAKWQEYKASLSCAHCGFSHPAAIDFHHPDPKASDVKVYIYVSSRSYKKAFAEASRCIPLCANCHRIHHYRDQEN
jgi:hypothetical protein